MNKVMFFAMLAGAIGFAVVAATGVDLANSRTGFGLILLGLGISLWSIRGLFRPSGSAGAGLVCLSFLGGFYFVHRAALGGPVGLALPDVTLVLTFLCVYFLAAVGDFKIKKVLLSVLAILCFANVSVAFLQKFGEEAFFVWKDAPESGRLVSGLFGHYNPFTGFMNGSVFFSATLIFFAKKPWVRFVCGVLVLGILASVVFGNSRGGWVSLVIGAAIWIIMVLAYLKQKQSKAFGAAMVAGILVSFVGLASSAWMVQKITNQRAETAFERLGVEGSKQVRDGGRITFQQSAFEIFQDSPLIGMGPRSFSYLSLENWDLEKRPIHDRPPEFVHNEYLQALADYGLIGLLIILVLILIHVILGCYRALTSESEKGDGQLALLQLGAIGGFVAILSQCFFSFLLHTPSCMALLALLAGILASRGESGQAAERKMILERFSGALGLVAALALLVVGGILSHSYVLSLKANRQMAQIDGEESALRALNTMINSAQIGRDPEIFEIAGRSAMKFAQGMNQSKRSDLEERFFLKAKEAFQGALRYNPHFPAGLAGLPRVEDALGNWELAEEGHELAMKKLWSREFKLRPHYYAAQSAYASALRSLYDGDRDRALLEFRKAQDRLNQRHDIMKMSSIRHKEKGLIAELAAWVDFMEAQVLFKKGDEIWKNTRPRNPELAYGLMLEAQKRFQACETVVKDKNPNWERLVKQLEFYLGVLEGGRVQPVQFTEEELAEILGREAVLDSRSTSR